LRFSIYIELAILQYCSATIATTAVSGAKKPASPKRVGEAGLEIKECDTANFFARPIPKNTPENGVRASGQQGQAAR
jgi:hypothetical protein